MKRSDFLFQVISLFLLASCATPTGTITPLVTPVPPYPSASLVPRPTSTPTLTSTPTPTSTPTKIPTPVPTSTYTPTRTPVYLGIPILPGSQPISVENFQNLELLATWGLGRANQVVYSPDGSTLLIASTQGIYFYDPETWQMQRFIPTTNEVTGSAYSPDGTFLALTFKEGAVELWQAPDGTLLRTLENPSGKDSGNPLFSPDGEFIFSGSEDNIYRMRRVSDGKLIKTFKGLIYNHDFSYRRESTFPASVSISKDGAYLATSIEYNNVITIWDISTGNLVYQMDGSCFAFSPSEMVLAVCKRQINQETGPSIQLLKISNWKIIYTMSGHDRNIYSLSFSHSGNVLLSHDMLGKINLWNVSDGSLLTNLEPGGSSDPFAMDMEKDVYKNIIFSPDDKQITSISINGKILVWNYTENSKTRIFTPFMNSINSVAFSPDGLLLATGDDQSVRIWNIQNGTIIQTIDQPRVEQLVFSGDSKTLAAGSPLSGIKLWNVNKGTYLREFYDVFTVPGFAFSPDGTIVALGDNYDISLYQIPSGKLNIRLDQRFAYTLAFSPDGDLLAAGSRFNAGINIWRISTQKKVAALAWQANRLLKMRFSPDGNYLAISCYGNSTLWRVSDGRQIGYLLVSGYDFSTDLSMVADIIEYAPPRVVRIWQFPEGNAKHTMWYEVDVLSIAFSPDSRLLAIGLANGTVQIWGVRE